MNQSDEQAYFDYLTSRSLKSRLYKKYFLYPRLARFLSGSVLDIGCGIGDFLAFRPGTVGVDINLYNVRYCLERGLPAQLVEGSALPFRDHSFDGAILDNVIEHLTDSAPLLAESRRVLRPGATLVIGVPGPCAYRADSDHKRFYDEASLIACAERGGFRLRRILHAPLKSEFLARRASQYCLYGVFSVFPS